MRTFRLASGFLLATGFATATNARTEGPQELPSPMLPRSAGSSAGQSTGATHPPALNHVYVVLDAATFAAIRESVELARLLGRSDGGLPDYAPPAPDADRIFFRGRQTYLEIFAPDNRFREPVGKVGLALGYDEPARFHALEQAWRTACGSETRRSRVEFERTQAAVPWYDAVQCDNTAAGSDLAVWAMVYRPEFHRWQSGAIDTPPRVARADVLAGRAAAGQGKFDITALEIDLIASLHAKLVKQLEQAGFQREDRLAGTHLRGDGLELLLRAVNGDPGLVSMSVATDAELSNDLLLGSVRIAQRSKGSAQLQFGNLAGD